MNLTSVFVRLIMILAVTRIDAAPLEPSIIERAELLRASADCFN